MASREDKQNGSICKRKDGRWEVRVTNGIDYATGKTVRISHCFRTRQEAVNDFQRINCELRAGTFQNPSSITLEAWYKYWLENYKKNTIKPSTYVSYEGFLRVHFAPVLGSMRLVNVTGFVLQEFFNYKFEEEELSPKTIANIHRALHECMAQSVKLKMLPDNPTEAVVLPGHRKKEIEIFTVTQQRALMAASYQSRYGVFVRLMLCTGLRVGELLGLQWPDIDFEKGELHVRRTLNRLHDYSDEADSKTKVVFGDPKSKTSARTILLPQTAMQELRLWQTQQECDVKRLQDSYANPYQSVVTNEQGGWIEPRTFRDYYDKMLADAGLPHFTCHATRHTFATRALERKMDFKTLSVILGHTSVAFTMDTYAHVQDDLKRESMNLMDDLYAQPIVSTVVSYPVEIEQNENGYAATAPNLPQLKLSGASLPDVVAEAMQAVPKLLAGYTMLPPAQEANTIPVPQGGMVLMVSSQASAK